MKDSWRSQGRFSNGVIQACLGLYCGVTIAPHRDIVPSPIVVDKLSIMPFSMFVKSQFSIPCNPQFWIIMSEFIARFACLCVGTRALLMAD